MIEWGASRILALRKHAGMTQAQLARWLGVSIKQVKYLEHQRRNPSGPTQRLLDILAYHLSYGGVAAIQVLGASSGQLRFPADVLKPNGVVIESRADGNGNGSGSMTTTPDSKPNEADSNGHDLAPDDKAFVWF
jgi:transcriptional regulator with XRE-family HTH domain